jgi:cobalt-zinc-cadmium efflux system membrane fusion protein
MWRFTERIFTASVLLGMTVGCTDADEVLESDEEALETRQARPAQSLQLPAEAQAAIGLETVRVEEREVPQLMAATGWLVVPAGHKTVVSAAATGFVTPSGRESFPLGESVAQDQVLAKLQVLVSPQEQAQLVIAKEEADILIRQSQASLELAEAQLDRLSDTPAGAVAGTRLLELQEVVARSRAAEQEAREQLPFLPQEPYERGLSLKPIDIAAPLSGRLIQVHVAPRQLVVQGDPLWTIADWSRLWIRVPVYTSDLSRVKLGDPVQAMLPDASLPVEARPVDVPQPTEPGKQTVPLLYEIDNTAGNLRPGQAVAVSLPIGEQAAAVVIPQSAVLWDGFGNSSVYVRTSPESFERRGVELGQLLADGIGVRRGLHADDEVVTEGAEALYGEEFHWELEAEDDD